MLDVADSTTIDIPELAERSDNVPTNPTPWRCHSSLSSNIFNSLGIINRFVISSNHSRLDKGGSDTQGGSQDLYCTIAEAGDLALEGSDLSEALRTDLPSIGEKIRIEYHALIETIAS